MDISTSNLCDKILEIALQGAYLMQGNRFSFQKVCEATGASSDQSEAALLWLWKNSYLEKTENTFVLTPPGEIFAKAGGCTGQRERQIKEEAAKQEQRELIKKQSRNAFITLWCTIIMALATCAIAWFAYTQSNLTSKMVEYEHEKTEVSSPQSK